MLAFIMTAALFSGIGHVSTGAAAAFNSGELYLRTIGMEPEGDFRRHGATGIPEYSEGCESSRALDRELERWNRTMLRLWEHVNTEETTFTLRAGNEYLLYETFFLFYACDDDRVNISVHPEELWRILQHLDRNPSAVTSQIALEGWHPGLEETGMAFIGPNDPAFDTVQALLERGREAIPQE